MKNDINRRLAIAAILGLSGISQATGSAFPAARKPAKKFTLADADRMQAADVKRLRKRKRNRALQQGRKP
jgi:hypothetical protein